jgi:hypothetical protein
VVVPIDSASRPGHKMEGTRLTLVKVGRGACLPVVADMTLAGCRC